MSFPIVSVYFLNAEFLDKLDPLPLFFLINYDLCSTYKIFNTNKIYNKFEFLSFCIKTMYFLVLNYLGKRSNWMCVKQLLTVIYVASIIKLLIICFIWIRSFFSSVRLSFLCVLFVILKLNQQSMFFINVQLLILWNQLLLFFETDLDFPDLTLQAALFGFINESDNNLNVLQNYTLIFKLYVYQWRERGVLNLNRLIKNVTKVKKLERKIASACEKKTIQFNIKWKSTHLKINV